MLHNVGKNSQTKLNSFKHNKSFSLATNDHNFNKSYLQPDNMHYLISEVNLFFLSGTNLQVLMTVKVLTTYSEEKLNQGQLKYNPNSNLYSHMIIWRENCGELKNKNEGRMQGMCRRS